MSQKQDKGTVEKMMTWVIAMIVMLIAWNLIGNYLDDEYVKIPMPYSHFVQNFDDIKELRLLDDSTSFHYVLNGESSIYQSAFPPGKATPIIDALTLKGIYIDIDPPPAPVGLGTMALMSIIPVLILVAALVWLSRKGGSGAAAAFGGSPAQLVNPEDNKTTLDDVAGNPGDFDEVYELVEFLHNPRKFWRAGAELPHGVLFFGPPGCGKTLLARAIAGEAKVPFFIISGSDFVEMFVGVGASRTKYV